MIKRNIFIQLLVLIISGCAFFILSLPASGYENERIIYFHSDINVHSDSSMTVTENIKVKATGNQIKRGIYRDFPTIYKDRLGNKYVVDFNLIKAQRDGVPENYHFKNLSNGVRVYIGRENYFLPPGEYTYTIVYKTNRQLGFFKDFDELYWNVTGNGWVFPIDEAQATVKLPGGASARVLNIDAYTGGMGSKEKAFSASTDMLGDITFQATRPLRAYEGLTILVSWPKGYVQEPTFQMKLGYFIRDNHVAIVGLLGLLILLAYYLIVWHRFGRDPSKGAIIPLFNPPDKISPAAMRYIMKMGYDNKVLTAALINMAVKGYLKIIDLGGLFTIKKTGEKESELTREETVVARQLLGHDNEINLKSEKHQIINGTIRNLKSSLGKNLEKVYFFSNIQYFTPGVILSIFVVIAAILSAGLNPDSCLVAFMSIWLTLWTFGAVFLLRQAISAWKTALSGPSITFSSLIGALSLSILATPFIAGEIMGLGMLLKATSVSVIVIMASMVFINFLFHHLLKAPTLAGRKIMDKIEGFKMYLSIAEKERLNLLNPPEKTPELFEKYLPYALALDVEQVWAEQFSGALEQAAQAGQRYSPVWYVGSRWDYSTPSDFTSSISSLLSGAISSSSVAPGSGAGGGGGSGGGGGGGGGGGW